MKDFFKYVGATVVGLIIYGILMTIFLFIGLMGVVASGSQVKNVKDNSVLVLKLSGVMSERAEKNILDDLGGSVNKQIGLDKLLTAIHKAKDNDKVKGIYIEAGAFGADSYASLQALRNALADFKTSKKWIVAYGDIYTQGTYYLASVADKVYLNPSGQINWGGITSQRVFVKDLLSKFGVKVQVAKVGTYKSATEMFTGDKMSDANREQTETYIKGIWNTVTHDVSTSRKVSVEQLNNFADSLITLANPQDYVSMKLVDGLLYTDQVKDVVKGLLKIDKDDAITQIAPADMANAPDKSEGDDKIAVYYAYGDIVDGASSVVTSGHAIDAQVVCKDLEKLRNDDDVKAVVIRVNSGGGSAYASEQIWRQVNELKKVKPVVISMGGMAASGAYYMSAPASWIVAEPTTLTGSIGIFGMFPDMSGLLKDELGLKFDEANTNKYSGFGTLTRPFTPDEMKYLEAYINRGYNLFRQRVADGRKMKTEEVEKIAQGHVWIGTDALKIRLVDQLGGLDDAVKKAAALAKTTSYYTGDYPEPGDWTDQILKSASADNYLDEQMRETLGVYYQPLMFVKTVNTQSCIQARLPYFMNIN